MTVCVNCHGQGAVLDRWDMATCPACDGSGEVDLGRFDDDAAGCMVAAIGIGLVLGAVLIWPVVMFFWGVLT